MAMPSRRRHGRRSRRRRRSFRELGARLSAARAAIVWYRLWEYTPWIPCESAVRAATGVLTLLSNSMYKPERDTPIPRDERSRKTADRIRAVLLLEGPSRAFWTHFRQVFRARRAACQDAVSSVDRPKRLAELARKRHELEQREEAIVLAAERDGLELDRRADASPAVVVCTVLAEDAAA